MESRCGGVRGCEKVWIVVQIKVMGKFEGQCEGNNYTACTTALQQLVGGNETKLNSNRVINVYTEHIRVTYRKELHAGNIYRIEGIGKKLPLRRLQPGETLPILRIADVSLDARMN